MPILEEIGDAIRSIQETEDDAKRVAAMKTLLSSTGKLTFKPDGRKTLIRTWLFKALQTLKVNDWVVNKTTSSGISESDAANMKDAMIALMVQVWKNTNTVDENIAATLSLIEPFASTEAATTQPAAVSFGSADEATDDLALLGLATAEVTEDAGHLLTNFAAQKTEVFTTDLDAAVKIVMTPDSNGMIHGNFGSTNMQSKEVARQLQTIAKYKIEGNDLQQFILATIGMEALSFAPKRQLSGTTDTVKLQSKHGPMSEVPMNMAVLTRIGGYLVNKVGIYNHRFAKYVSPSFHDDIIAFMKLDYDAVVNPPNLTSKDGWSWPFKAYNPVKRGFTTDDLLNL